MTTCAHYRDHDGRCIHCDDVDELRAIKYTQSRAEAAATWAETRGHDFQPTVGPGVATRCTRCNLWIGKWRGTDCPGASSATPAPDQLAEAQSTGDRELVAAADRATARAVVAAWFDAGHLTSPVGLDELRAGIAAALAARPRRAS